MNILICSAGRRVKLIRYFYEELHNRGGKVVVTDCDPTAPALQFADVVEIVPRIDHPEYILTIKELCKKHRIKAILSLIDPELSLLATHKDEFAAAGIKVIVSDREIVDICFDKYQTFKFLQKYNIPFIPVYLELEEILLEMENNTLNFPLIVKPRRGSASIGICKVYSINELRNLMEKSDDLIVQPFIEGDEYGVDCYIDLVSNQPTHIFGKRKIRMRAGETDKSEAVKDHKLISLIDELINILKPIGPIDIDCFKTETGYVISEINPRFGGGYLHCHESGQNFIKCIINNLLGQANETKIGDYKEGSVMIKFDDVVLVNMGKSITC